MNPNMSIFIRLNPRLLVQVGVGLDLLHWANMSNISLTFSNLSMCLLLYLFFGFMNCNTFPNLSGLLHVYTC